MSEAGLATERVLVCRTGNERFALPVALVREVVALPPLSRLPGTGEWVRGLANVHGVLVTVLAAPILEQSPESGVRTLPGDAGTPRGRDAEPPPALLVVLTLHRGQVGFAVEEVDELALPDARGVRMVNVEAVVRGVLGS